MPSNSAKPYVYRRRVAFYETDLMGVMHHSNHVKIFEEARVDWLRTHELLHIKGETGRVILAVVDVQVRYLRPLKFDDLMETVVELQAEGAKLVFRYAIWNARQQAYVATGSTTLVPLDDDLRPVRIESAARERLRQESWSAAWPPAPL